MRNDHTDSLLNLRGTASPAIVLLLQHYCQHLSCSVSMQLQAEALVDVCSTAFNSGLGYS
jgi:hypothetical protein